MTETIENYYESNFSAIFGSNVTAEDFGLYDQPVARDFRVAVLAVLAIIGGIGNAGLLPWLVLHRTRRSRFLNMFLHLTLADLLVVCCATSPQLVWEYASREWKGGDFLCRVFKFFQTFSICASNYLTVAIALDRHRATRRPLTPPWKVSFLGGGSWLVAAVVNSPTLLLFRETEHNGQVVCRNVLYDSPPFSLRIYLTAVVVLVFIAPLVVISICYLQIVLKIARKAREGRRQSASRDSSNSSHRSKKLVLQRNTGNESLPKAKVKTLRMTFVIITSFLACSAPYCIVEMWRVYGDYQTLGAATYSILAALAVSNSSTNPFVFFIFHQSSGRKRNISSRNDKIRGQVTTFRKTCCGGNDHTNKRLDSWCDSEWRNSSGSAGTKL